MRRNERLTPPRRAPVGVGPFFAISHCVQGRINHSTVKVEFS